MVRFGSPDLRTGALGVKRVRGTVSPYSRGRAGPKKAHFGQNSKFEPRSTFRGDLLLRRSTVKEGGVRIFIQQSYGCLQLLVAPFKGSAYGSTPKTNTTSKPYGLQKGSAA